MSIIGLSYVRSVIVGLLVGLYVYASHLKLTAFTAVSLWLRHPGGYPKTRSGSTPLAFGMLCGVSVVHVSLYYIGLFCTFCLFWDALCMNWRLVIEYWTRH